MGDYIKGRKPLEQLPEKVKQGVLLHRKIDLFTDKHPSTARAKALFRPDYRLYSGAFIDSLYDHFLANDPRFFANTEALGAFAARCYTALQDHIAYMPASFAALFPYMKEHNWLYGYRTLKGMERAFKGLVHRAKYLDSSDRAYEIFVRYYYELNQYYFDFIDDIIAYVKRELNDMLPEI